MIEILIGLLADLDIDVSEQVPFLFVGEHAPNNARGFDRILHELHLCLRACCTDPDGQALRVHGKVLQFHAFPQGSFELVIFDHRGDAVSIVAQAVGDLIAEITDAIHELQSRRPVHSRIE